MPVVVENRAGASGALGTAAAARAAPDGNTWVLVFDTHAVNPALIPTIGFDTQRDLTPLLLFGTAPMVLTAHRTRPYRSVAQVVEAAKARPETVTYGTIGNGSLAHLTMALAQRAGGFSLVHVPYRGGGPLAVAAVAGEVDLPIATRPAIGVHIDSGALVPLAQTGATRSPSMPDIPTLAESGIPGIDARAFWGFLGPANLPAAVKQRMEAAIRGALDVPEIRSRVLGLGIDLDPQGRRCSAPSSRGRWRSGRRWCARTTSAPTDRRGPGVHGSVRPDAATGGDDAAQHRSVRPGAATGQDDAAPWTAARRPHGLTAVAQPRPVQAGPALP